MVIFARAGVVDRVLAESVHLGFARLFDAHLRQVGETAFAGAGCPWEFQCSLPQWQTERILADRVVELGGTVERGVEAVSVRQRDDGVLIGLKREDGTAETVEASWVIGAGGAHSVTRESMAETMVGTTYPGRPAGGDRGTAWPGGQAAAAVDHQRRRAGRGLVGPRWSRPRGLLSR